MPTPIEYLMHAEATLLAGTQTAAVWSSILDIRCAITQLTRLNPDSSAPTEAVDS